MAVTKLVVNCETGEVIEEPFSDAELTSQATTNAAAEMSAAQTIALAKIRTDGIAHAISLGFTQAQAEAMFP